MRFVNLILNKFEEIFVITALGIASIVTFTEVILRFLGTGLGFSYELTNYLLIWVGMIGASIGVRENVHLGVDLLIKVFSLRTQKIILLVVHLISAIFAIIIAYLGFLHVLDLIGFGQLSPEMELPLYIPRSLIPIAFTLIAIRFLQQFVNVWKMPAADLENKEVVIHD